jgi:hypothetical protein
MAGSCRMCCAGCEARPEGLAFRAGRLPPADAKTPSKRGVCLLRLGVAASGLTSVLATRLLEGKVHLVYFSLQK